MQIYSPAADRNRGPILAVLERALPGPAAVLEVASGTGQHAAYFAAARPDWSWQPSDPDEPSRASIAAYTAGLTNVHAPLAIDAVDRWPVTGALDAIVAINLVHIAPWSVALALFTAAGARLGSGGVLFLYGPYAIGGVLAPSNAAFDADLRARNSAWGVRALDDLVAAAAPHRLELESMAALPANNHALVFRRR